MAFSVNLELVFTEGEAHYIGLYNLNLAEIAVNAIKDKLVEQYEIDMSLTYQNPKAELMDLKERIRAMRLENEKLRLNVRKPSAFARLIGDKTGERK